MATIRSEKQVARHFKATKYEQRQQDARRKAEAIKERIETNKKNQEVYDQ